MSEVMRTVIDGFALAILFLSAVGACVSTNRLSMRLFSLGLYGLIALAVVSCAAPQSPVRETSAERCADMLDVYCAKASSCFGVSLSECRSYKADCAAVGGITQDEAEACTQAMVQSTCADSVPRACTGIADPPAENDPDRRTL